MYSMLVIIMQNGPFSTVKTRMNYKLRHFV